jgi:hypothetical protein
MQQALCRLCDKHGGTPISEYTKAGTAASDNSRRLAVRTPNKGPEWVAAYLDEKLADCCDVDTGVCDQCIAPHELHYSRKYKWVSTPNEMPLCAAGFWSCTKPIKEQINRDAAWRSWKGRTVFKDWNSLCRKLFLRVQIPQDATRARCIQSGKWKRCRLLVLVVGAQ